MMILEDKVVVVSDDGGVRGEVAAVVALRPGASTVFTAADGVVGAVRGRGRRIVVIDDEGRADAIDLVRQLMGEREISSVIYLATNHTPDLEGAVRRAGASFYTVKAARERDLTRVIETLLG